MSQMETLRHISLQHGGLRPGEHAEGAVSRSLLPFLPFEGRQADSRVEDGGRRKAEGAAMGKRRRVRRSQRRTQKRGAADTSCAQGVWVHAAGDAQTEVQTRIRSKRNEIQISVCDAAQES